MSSGSYNNRDGRSQEAPTVRIVVRKNSSKQASSAVKAANRSTPVRMEPETGGSTGKVIGMHDGQRSGKTFIAHHGSQPGSRPTVTKNGVSVKAEPVYEPELDLDLDLDIDLDLGTEDADTENLFDEIPENVIMSDSMDDDFDMEYYDYLDADEYEEESRRVASEAPVKRGRGPITVSGKNSGAARPAGGRAFSAAAGAQVRELSRNVKRAGKAGMVSVSRSVEAAGAEMLSMPGRVRPTMDAVRSGVLVYRTAAPGAIRSYCAEIPQMTTSFFERHNFARWAKSRTPSQWVKTAFAALGILFVIAIGAGLLYFDSMLDKINYTSADKYEQLSEEEADALEKQLSGDDDDEEEDEGVVSDTSTPIVIPTVASEPEAPKADVPTKKLSEFTDSMYDIKKEDVMNILLLGTDTRENAYVRDNSDTMILCSINKKDKNIKLTSFMRDSYVTIPGYSSQKRLNSAFASGGASLLFKTLKKNFNVEVSKYVRVNFVAFKKIVDAVGGIDMKLTDKEANYMCNHKVYGKFPRFKAGGGVYRLSGAEALNYARCRKVDSDFGRTERQRKVIAAAADKLKHASIPVLTALMNELLPLVETNLTKEEIYALIPTGLASISKDIEMLNIPINGSWSDYKTPGGQSVIKVNFTKNKKAYKAHVFSSTRLENASVADIAHFEG